MKERLAERRLGVVYRAFREAIEHGLAHQTAEDQQLGGRLITLRGQPLVLFGSASYVGLETDLRIKNAACEAIMSYGVQFASSRAYISCPPYRELEQLLGEIFEAPLVMAQTTTLAHLAALPVLIGKSDALIYDESVHNSFQEVLPKLRAQGVSDHVADHNRMDVLEEMISKLTRVHEHVWCAVEGIYSMHGDVAPASALHDLLGRHPRLHLYVDDAHGMSWTGKHGRGHFLGHGRVPPRTVVVASLAKAFAAGGAVLVFPDAESADLVRTCGSTMTFSGPLQPPLIGAGIASARIHLSPEINERQQKLLERIQLFNSLAREKNVPLASWDATPIRFIMAGSNEATFHLGAALMAEGYFANPAVFPAVYPGRGGLRVTLTLHHTLDDIRNLLDAVERWIAR